MMRSHLHFLGLALIPFFLACSGGERQEGSDFSQLWPNLGEPLDQSVVDYSGPQMASLMVPGSRSATAWLPEGTFWNGDVELAITGEDGRTIPFHGKEILEPGVFVYRSICEVEGVRYEAVAFKPWLEPTPIAYPWTCIELIVSNPNEASRSVSLGARFRSDGGRHGFLHPRADAATQYTYRTRSHRVYREGRIIALLPAEWSHENQVPSEEALPFDVTGVQVRHIAELPAGGEVRFRFWLAPAGETTRAPPGPIVESSLAPLISETRKAWKVSVFQGATFVFADPEVQRVFDASRAVAVSCFEYQKKKLVPIGNPFQYREFFLRDGARLSRALALLGREDLAQIVLSHMYEFQWPPGAFLSQKGQLDGTGQVLWSLSQLAQLSRNSEWVEPYLEPSVRAAEWVHRMRAYSTARGSHSAGLLPFSDPRDNELIAGHLLGSDAWTYAGLRGLAGLFESKGQVAEAERWNSEADEYRTILIAIWEREAIRQGRPLPPAVEAGARDWGNLSVVYPLGLFAPEDAASVELDTWMRSRRYSQGLPFYGTPDSLHHYLGFDLTQASLRRGERSQVAADLAAYVDRCQPDGTGFEIIDRDTRDFAQNLPPHPTFASMFVDLGRSILVYEGEENLHLFSGAPASWFVEGSSFGFQNAPTTWGPASAELRAEGGGTLILSTDLPTTAVVDLPREFQIDQVEGGDYILSAEESRVHLSPGKKEWTIRYR